MQHCSTAFSITRTRNCERAPLALQVEFAAAHEKLALWIGTDEAAFVVEKLRPTDRQNSHQVSCFSCLVVEESERLISSSVKCLCDGEERKRSELNAVRIVCGRCPP